MSVLTFIPMVDDDGKYLTCRAENPFIPDSAIEDKWRIVVHCKYSLIIFLFKLTFTSDTISIIKVQSKTQNELRVHSTLD